MAKNILLIISLLSFISLSFSTIESYPSCEEAYDSTIGIIAAKEEGDLTFEPKGISDCIDLPSSSGLYEKCCYVRFAWKGKTHHGCVGLNSYYFERIDLFIDIAEKGNKIFNEEFRDSKIYHIDCNAKYLAMGLISLLALFF